MDNFNVDETYDRIVAANQADKGWRERQYRKHRNNGHNAITALTMAKRSNFQEDEIDEITGLVVEFEILEDCDTGNDEQAHYADWLESIESGKESIATPKGLSRGNAEQYRRKFLDDLRDRVENFGERFECVMLSVGIHAVNDDGDRDELAISWLGGVSIDTRGDWTLTDDYVQEVWTELLGEALGRASTELDKRAMTG